ncbi:hypothetical protein [Kribbella sp. NPDC051620]|uniref:hypothetical protein n=1 Tax=Kribbella sp. NPDC051620 TaxID=3364120 RepID=UPI0037BB249D
MEVGPAGYSGAVQVGGFGEDVQGAVSHGVLDSPSRATVVLANSGGTTIIWFELAR